jgi:hypothetical protein
MRLVHLLVVGVLLVPSAADAQITAADGIKAIARGDYTSAVRILQPLGEDASHPDPIALFFLATLYESGHGVAMNPIRACSLYLRAATPTNPLRTQALALAERIHQDVSFMWERCSAATVGLWRDPPAVSFALGPNHMVRFDQEGFAVSYNGIRKVAALTLSGPGWTFLPTRHTQVDVTRPTAAHRHFIEFFIWMPDTASGPGTWNLQWVVFEIVGTETISVPTGGTVASAVATQPPVDDAIENLAQIRLNANGAAEWAILGPTPRSAVIADRGSR